MRPREPVLCYVRGQWAYFTTQELDRQWGDDWDDAPYEHNAGPPYEPGLYHYADGRTRPMRRDWNSDGTPKWRIVKLAYDGDSWREACDYFTNSPWSVQQVNAGCTPWLLGHDCVRGKAIVIPAGTGLDEFRRLIALGGGRTYEPITVTVKKERKGRNDGRKQVRMQQGGPGCA